MPQLLSFAFRNILRNRRRSLAVILTAALGVAAMLLFAGYARSVSHSVETGTVRHHGHLQIQRRGYFLHGAGSPERYGIVGYRELAAALRTEPGLAEMLTVVTPTLQFQGIAGNFEQRLSLPVAGLGLVAQEQNRMRQWNAYGGAQLSKPVPLPLAETDAAAIGVGVARILRLDGTPPEPREQAWADAPAGLQALVRQESASGPAETSGSPRLDLLGATAAGAPNVVSVRVAALEHLGVKEADDRHLALHLPLAQRLVYGQAEPRVTALVLQLQSSAQVERARQLVAGFIERRGLDLEVLDFHTLAPSCGQIQALFRSILGFFAILIGVIILFSVANVMSTAVIERTAEIGTLRALGLGRGGIVALFLAEGALLGSIGTSLGCALGMATAFAVNQARLTWTPPNYSEGVLLEIKLFDQPSLFLFAILVLSLLAMAAAALPARRASRIPVVEALRHAQ